MADEPRDSTSSTGPAPIDDPRARAFLTLVGTGQLDAVRRVLADRPLMARIVGPHPFWGGRPQPLHVAIETKRRDMFALLLAAGADVDGVNDQYDHWSPLMLTSHHHLDDMRDELLRRGARVGLAEALLFADDARVAALLEPGAPALPVHAPNGGSLLNFARTPFAIDRLLELGVATDVTDRWGATPMESMSRLGAAGQPLVRHLLARGLPAPPETFARLGDRAALDTLITADPLIASSPAVLMGAVDFGHHALVEWLLARGAPVDARARPPSRHTALHSAAWNGDLPMVRLLLRAGADPAAQDDEHQGTARGWAEVAVDVTNNRACAEVAALLAEAEGEQAIPG